MEKKKVYEETWFVVVMLIFLAPVGIFLMWKQQKFKSVPRVILSVLFGIVFLAAIFSPKDDIDSTQVAKVESTVKPTPKPTKKPTKEELAKKKKEKEEKEYLEWIESQFSAWDGSHTGLVKLVKENMNDPKSFEHAETSYKDMGTGKGITVYMTYRGKNAFGGVVKGEVVAYADYETNTVEIIEAD